MAYTTIDDPSAHFHIQLYTGNGSSGHAITNDANAGDFQPDWVWIKNRGAGGHNMIFDSTRGATKAIYTNLTNAEGTVSGHLTAFDSDGFTLGDNSGVGSSNGNTETYVAWQWKANGGTRTTFSEVNNNPAGGYQANTTAGFSIVDYTGTGANGTVSHGLGAVPEFIIVKNRTTGLNWAVYSVGLNFPTDDLLYLNLTNAANQHDPTWNNVVPTSSVFTVGSYTLTNEDSSALIAYCWTPIQGYSKFGGYTGNGNADGPFVYTGFKSSFVMVKPTSDTGEWAMFDTKRNAYNETNDVLRANNTAAESDSSGDNSIDILSNGFKMTGNGGWTNTDARAYIYAAFAENPFVTSGGVPCTAR